MSGPRDYARGGFTPAQHHSYAEDQYEIDSRIVEYAGRIRIVTDRDGFPKEVVKTPDNVDTLGDQLGNTFWPKSSRKIPGWFHGIPAVAVEGATTDVFTGPGSSSPEPGMVLPALDGSWAPDSNFSTVKVSPPPGVPMPAPGDVGYVQAGSDSADQDYLWLPIASGGPNGGGSPFIADHVTPIDFSTTISDVNGRGQVNSIRRGGAQYLTEVVRPNSGIGWQPALNLRNGLASRQTATPDEREKIEGRAGKGMFSEDGDALGHLAHLSDQGGPIMADKSCTAHDYGSFTEDGITYHERAGHLSTKAFHKVPGDPVRDAPLDYKEGFFIPSGHPPIPKQAEIRLDVTAQHEWNGQVRPNMWRLQYWLPSRDGDPGTVKTGDPSGSKRRDEDPSGSKRRDEDPSGIKRRDEDPSGIKRPIKVPPLPTVEPTPDAPLLPPGFPNKGLLSVPSEPDDSGLPAGVAGVVGGGPPLEDIIPWPGGTTATDDDIKRNNELARAGASGPRRALDEQFPATTGLPGVTSPAELNRINEQNRQQIVNGIDGHNLDRLGSAVPAELPNEHAAKSYNIIPSPLMPDGGRLPTGGGGAAFDGLTGGGGYYPGTGDPNVPPDVNDIDGWGRFNSSPRGLHIQSFTSQNDIGEPVLLDREPWDYKRRRVAESQTMYITLPEVDIYDPMNHGYEDANYSRGTLGIHKSMTFATGLPDPANTGDVVDGLRILLDDTPDANLDVPTIEAMDTAGDTDTTKPVYFKGGTILLDPQTSAPTGEAGMIRFNDTTRNPEYHDGTSWVAITGTDWQTVVVNYTDLNVVSNVGTFAFVELPDLTEISGGMIVVVDTLFAGVTEVTAEIGDGVTANLFFDTVPVSTGAGASTGERTPTMFDNSYFTVGTTRLFLTVTGDSALSALTAGSLTIYYKKAKIG